MVSVILTSYNRPRLVQEAIRSVQAQTYPDWELVIVDDHSNDETQAVLAEAVRTDPSRLTLIQTGVRPEDRPRTARYATCINLAIPLLKGQLVSYLTDDDIYYPDRLERMVGIFRERPDVYVVYGQQRLVELHPDGSVREIGIRPCYGITRSPMGRIDHNSVMHRRSCFDVVGSWDDSPQHWLHADAAFFAKLARHWDFYPVDHVTEEHRFHADTIQSRMARGEPPWAPTG